MAGTYQSLLTVLQGEAFQNRNGNVFLIGPTQVGKSTLAWRLCFEESGVDLVPIQASRWIKEKFREADFASYPDYVTFLTRKSRELLAKNPDLCVDRVRGSFNSGGGGCVIEGVRNPRDFVHLFDHRKDLVVFLSRGGLVPVNEFEQGITVIRAYVGWLDANFGSAASPFWMEIDL